MQVELRGWQQEPGRRELLRRSSSLQTKSPEPHRGPRWAAGQRTKILNILNILQLLLCWYHSDSFSPVKSMWPSSHLRFGSRQFFEFLLIEPVVWMNCIVPLSYKNTLLLLVFTLLKEEQKVSVRSWNRKMLQMCRQLQDFCKSESVNSYQDHVLRFDFGEFGSRGICWQRVTESTESVQRHVSLRREQEITLHWSVITQTFEYNSSHMNEWQGKLERGKSCTFLVQERSLPDRSWACRQGCPFRQQFSLLWLFDQQEQDTQPQGGLQRIPLSTPDNKRWH